MRTSVIIGKWTLGQALEHFQPETPTAPSARPLDGRWSFQGQLLEDADVRQLAVLFNAAVALMGHP